MSLTSSILLCLSILYCLHSNDSYLQYIEYLLLRHNSFSYGRKTLVKCRIPNEPIEFKPEYVNKALR